MTKLVITLIVTQKSPWLDALNMCIDKGVRVYLTDRSTTCKYVELVPNTISETKKVVMILIKCFIDRNIKCIS